MDGLTNLLLQRVLVILVQVGTLVLDLALELVDADLLAGEFLVVVRLLLDEALDRRGRDGERARRGHPGLIFRRLRMLEEMNMIGFFLFFGLFLLPWETVCWRSVWMSFFVYTRLGGVVLRYELSVLGVRNVFRIGSKLVQQRKTQRLWRLNRTVKKL